jgi:dihydrofolate reductase
MKVTVYMTTTINGFVAKENDDTSFISETEWKAFPQFVKQVGAMVVGSKTYALMQKGNEFDDYAGVTIVVLANSSSFKPENPSHLYVSSPKDAIELLEKRGVREVVVAGSGATNGSFMRENLVDEIVLDVEPVAFGKGIQLFGDANFDTKLQLIGTKQLSPDEIRLRYKVGK